MSENQDILLINRDMDFLDAMAGFIHKAGFTVHTAMDMRNALSTLSKSPIGLIVCDNVLQDVSGYDFLRFLKNDPLRESIPFVFFVPINDQGRAFKAFELGAVDFMVYPLEVEDLITRIEELLDTPADEQFPGVDKEADVSAEEAESKLKEETVAGDDLPAHDGPPSLEETVSPKESPPAAAVAQAPNVRIDLSRDGILWMPGQIKNFTAEGILVVTALLGKPGVDLDVRFPIGGVHITLKGQIKHVVFDNFEKPVGIGIALDGNDEWSQVLDHLKGLVAPSAEEQDADDDHERPRQQTAELSPEAAGTMLLPQEPKGLNNTLLLTADEEPDEKPFDLRFYHSLIGKELDNYRAVSFIGAGTMGGVFKGWDSALEREVALKVISYELSEQEAFRDMFVKEARLISKLDHPNIAHIYAIGNPDEIMYFAMEFIDGDTLADLITKHNNLYTLRGLDYLITVCETLDFVWQKNIIHRDIKPDNILINDKGILKIVDFGVAKKIDVNASGDNQDGIVGSPLYISPDSIMKDTVDHRSDIYSLGATFYHVFTGMPPFEGEDTKDVLLKHVNEEMIPLNVRNPKISVSLAKICQKMMAKEPEDRYQDYQGIVKDLKAFRARVIHAKKQGAGTLRPVPGNR